MFEFFFAIFEALSFIFGAIGAVFVVIGTVAEFIIKFAAIFLLALPPALLYIASQIFQAFEFYEYASFIESHCFFIGLLAYVIEYLILKYRYKIENFL